MHAGPFDLILMDVQMPTMDGLQATRAIRQLASTERNSVPIVALTAFGMKSDRERCLAAGMDGYLSKPIDPAELCATIEGLVERPTARG
jgi:two-component system sensor histidine kinase/response regulator